MFVRVVVSPVRHASWERRLRNNPLEGEKTKASLHETTPFCPPSPPPRKRRAKYPFAKSCKETHSSSPRKDVSVHGTTRFTRPPGGGGILGAKAWKRRQTLGVEAGSELTDVRSVLQSYEVQEESEDGDGLLASSPSRSPSFSSIVAGTDRWGTRASGETKGRSKSYQEFLLGGTKAVPSLETVHPRPGAATEDTNLPSPFPLGRYANAW